MGLVATCGLQIVGVTVHRLVRDAGVEQGMGPRSTPCSIQTPVSGSRESTVREGRSEVARNPVGNLGNENKRKETPRVGPNKGVPHSGIPHSLPNSMDVEAGSEPGGHTGGHSKGPT